MWSNILRNVPKIKNTSRVVCDFRDAKGGGNTGNALIEGILLYLQLTSETAVTRRRGSAATYFGSFPEKSTIKSASSPQWETGATKMTMILLL